LNERWNLIGIAGSEVAVGSIVTVPAGIIWPEYYSYDGSYHLAYSLQPGKGYWVKASHAGDIILSTLPKANAARGINHDSRLDAYNKLKILDAQGRRQELYFKIGKTDDAALMNYELPPLPPAGAADIRFSSGRFVEHAERNSFSIIPVRMQSLKYPLTVSWTLRPEEQGLWSLNAKKSEIPLMGDGSTQLTGSGEIGLLYNGQEESVPQKISLEQNYPNPFNPTTTIRFGIPAASYISLDVYNVLGVLVKTLVRGTKDAGWHSTEWNGIDVAGNQVSSGLYFCRLEITDVNDPVKSFSQIRKMTFIK
jgi:hypothetical protein